MPKFVEANEKIAGGVTEGMQKIEDGVVGGYKEIEDGVVGGFKKIEDKFTEKFLNEDGTLKTGKVGDTVVDGYHKVADGIVDGFTKVTDKCVEKLFAKEGESVDDAKKRLSGDKQPQNQEDTNGKRYSFYLQLLRKGKQRSSRNKKEISSTGRK